MDVFWLCFVPLFVAVDAFGILPIFVSLTDEMDKMQLRTVIFQSVLTATGVALGFLAFGPMLLHSIGLTMPDFMIAGGILLLAISLTDLLTGDKKLRRIDQDSLGAVPIGIPLITGPAVLTTSILLAGIHGKLVTAAAVIINICIAGAVFVFSRQITEILGRTGTKTISKVASLLLAAIAVMLIRRGIIDILVLTGHN